MFGIKQKNPGWMSVIFSGDAVTLSHVLPSPEGAFEVKFLETFAAGTGAKAVLQRLKTAQHLKSYQCMTLMPDGEYMMTTMDAPPVPTDERAEALRWSLGEMLDYPVDQACIDVVDIPAQGTSSGKSSSVMVIAADEMRVKLVVAPFKDNDIPLEVIDIPELAQRNVAALLEDKERALAILRITDTGSLLTITFAGGLMVARRADVKASQLTSDDEDRRTRALERLVLEVQRALDNFDRQYSQMPVSRVLLAADFPTDLVAEELSASISVPLERLDFSKVIDVSRIPELQTLEGQARHLLSVGVALRRQEVSQ